VEIQYRDFKAIALSYDCDHGDECSMVLNVDTLIDWMLGSKRYFYHFTDTRNLPLISQHGLLSTNELRLRGISPITGGDATSLSIDATKGYDKFVHLCFRNNHPMEYAARMDGRIQDSRFLRIDPRVLRASGTLVSDMIVTANDVTIGPPNEMIHKLDLPVIYDRMDWKNPEVRARLNKAEKYEVLVLNSISLEYISAL